MSYTAPIKDMLFDIEHLANIAQVSQMPGLEEAGLETAQAVLEECARFNQDVIAPLNVEGDRNPSSFKDGRSRPRPASRRPSRSTSRAAGRACSIPRTSAARACPRRSARPASRC